jgi:hypothetical protein
VPPSLVRWTFNSPLRLVLVSLTVAGILGAGAVLAAVQRSPGTRQQDQPVATATPTRSATTNMTPTPTPVELVTAETHEHARDAARAFVTAWVHNGTDVSDAKWLHSIRPLATHALYRGLKQTDAAALPSGHLKALHLKQLGPYAGAATVTLTSGLILDVQLVADHGRWVVADIRPRGS